MATTPIYFRSLHFVSLSTPIFVNSTGKNGAYQTKGREAGIGEFQNYHLFLGTTIQISLGIISYRIEVVSQNYRIARFRRDHFKDRFKDHML